MALVRRALAISLLAAAPLALVGSCSTSDPGTTDAGQEAGEPPDAPAEVDAGAGDVEPTDGAFVDADAATDDATLDAADDAESDAADASDDAPADAAPDVDAGNPLCDVAAADFEPGLACGQALPVTIACTHTVTQSAIVGTCCTPKNPGAACDGTHAFCCADAGIYCGLVSTANVTLPATLVLTRASRKGKSLPVPGLPFCPLPVASTTKVTVAPTTNPTVPGVALAVSLYEQPRCNQASYTASFTRSDTVDVYSGTWRDHPSLSNNRDSSGNASVTVGADGTITYAAKGTVMMDMGANTQTWSRRANVGDCTATFTP
ncbi:MAG: hypothetical protein R3B36_22855 [Polyangiaceae bacterium]